MNIIPILIVMAVAATAAAAIWILIRRRSKRLEVPCSNLAAAGPIPAAAPELAAAPNLAAPAPHPGLTAGPFPLPGQAPASDPLSTPETACAEDAKPTILVAEDNPSNYKLVEVLLRNDYRLLHAENGVEAVALFRKHRPALILMDINMPEMDGYEALRRVREIDGSALAIALTAYAFESDLQRMRECGFTGSLTKPLDIRELKLTIRRTLGQEESQGGR